MPSDPINNSLAGGCSSPPTGMRTRSYQGYTGSSDNLWWHPSLYSMLNRSAPDLWTSHTGDMPLSDNSSYLTSVLDAALAISERMVHDTDASAGRRQQRDNDTEDDKDTTTPPSQ